MSKIDDDFTAELHAAILEAFDVPATPSPVKGKAPDREWLGGFLDQILQHRHPVSELIDQYTSAYWQIGNYEGIVSGLNRAAEMLRTRTGQHYANGQDDLARAMRGGAEVVDKEALKAATDTANAKKARGYGP